MVCHCLIHFNNHDVLFIFLCNLPTGRGWISLTVLTLFPSVSLPLSAQFLHKFCLKCLLVIVGSSDEVFFGVLVNMD